MTDNKRGHVVASIKVGGKDVSSDESLGEFSEVRVFLPDNGPARFEAIFLGAHPNWKFISKIGSGSKVEISLGYGDKPPVVFQGETTALRYRGQRSTVHTLILEGADFLHRLGRGNHQKVHLKVTDGELVKKLAGDAGLNIKEMEDPGIVYDSIAQYNQTNLELLMDRARRLGYCLWAEEANKVFFKPRGKGQKTVKLQMAKDINQTNIRSTIGHLATSVQVRAWDTKAKKEMVAKADTGTEELMGSGDAGSKVAKEFAYAMFTFGNTLPRSVKEAELIAKGHLLRRSMGFAIADVECLGAPEIVAGSKVDLSGYGFWESGEYHVQAVKHKWQRTAGPGEEILMTELKLRRNFLPS